MISRGWHMGSSCEIITRIDDPDAHRRAHDQLAQLEGRWSRFVPTSEISRINTADGCPVVVHPDTIRLLRSTVDAWQLTRGVFDPTIGSALSTLGYDQPFQPGMRRGDQQTQPAPGLSSMWLDETAGIVCVDAGVQIDPGGCGKGLAADMVTETLARHGHTDVVVNVGGDVRAVSASQPWTIDIDLGPRRTVSIGLVDGAVATSSTTHRRWTTTDGHDVHHLIDPSSGLPSLAVDDTVAVVANCGVWADVLASVAVIAGPHVVRRCADVRVICSSDMAAA
jgi:thiamine biosynthesis lipoprotein